MGRSTRKPVLMTKFRISIFLLYLKDPYLNYMIPRFGTDTTILYIFLRRLNNVSSVLISTKSNDVVKGLYIYYSNLWACKSSAPTVPW